MKLALILVAFALIGCSTPKKVMKNCVKVGQVVYECEEL